MTTRLPPSLVPLLARTSGPARRAPNEALIVDENVPLAEGLRLQLEARGYVAHVAHEADDGVTAARVLRPVLVFCALDLPNLGSYDLALRLRTSAATRAVSLVALTKPGDAGDGDGDVASWFDHQLSYLAAGDELDRVLAGAVAPRVDRTRRHAGHGSD